MRQQCSTRGLPPAWPPNGINPTAQQCPGYDAELPSLLRSAIQCIRGARSSLTLHQWTWSCLKPTLSKLTHLLF